MRLSSRLKKHTSTLSPRKTISWIDFSATSSRKLRVARANRPSRALLFFPKEETHGPSVHRIPTFTESRRTAGTVPFFKNPQIHAEIRMESLAYIENGRSSHPLPPTMEIFRQANSFSASVGWPQVASPRAATQPFPYLRVEPFQHRAEIPDYGTPWIGDAEPRTRSVFIPTPTPRRRDVEVNKTATGVEIPEIKAGEGIAKRPEGSECTICYDRIPNATLGCGHKMCMPCARKHFGENTDCPWCREKIRVVIRTFESE
jgi:hypothetical protein